MDHYCANCDCTFGIGSPRKEQRYQPSGAGQMWVCGQCHQKLLPRPPTQIILNQTIENVSTEHVQSVKTEIDQLRQMVLNLEALTVMMQREFLRVRDQTLQNVMDFLIAHEEEKNDTTSVVK